MPAEYVQENLPLLEKGACNMVRHIEIARMFGVPVVVAINRFPSDTAAELELARKSAESAGDLNLMIHRAPPCVVLEAVGALTSVPM